ncbi:alpha/beta hydrolase [Cryobacterium psychrophilum]|uniref:alpha/beta hydrolase n=1 Tax=Cryobacterium psychrophilum TaxID=41988 RepID=UPI0010D6DF94|nr:alpha/beta hydrolase [Cryobacterium psychrophilum]TDW30004.1 acetyl esterase/lipase [Cryobacterium psychrophilum]
MTTGRRPSLSGLRHIRPLSVVVAAVLAVGATAVLVGLDSGERHPGTSEATEPVIGIRTFDVPRGITVTEDVVYDVEPNGTPLTLDVCTPPTNALPTGSPNLRPAVVSIHGGSWTRGDKSSDDWRVVCEWLASEGFVAYSLDYRLTPAAPFPAAIDDISHAVEWIRDTDNAARFGIDPARIGAFGGSAGGNLAALLGTQGEGSLTMGSRVAAVAELSGPSDLRGASMTDDGASERLQKLAKRYLDCTNLDDCPRTTPASPVAQLDASDPPMFIGNSEKEFVPLKQATRFADELERLGIPYELVSRPGSVHSIGFLDADMRTRVAAFLHASMGF